jgi:hypothetical protein
VKLDAALRSMLGGERQKATITLGDIDYVGAIADLLEAFVYDAAGT